MLPYSKEYHEKNREKINKYAREHYYKNKEVRLEWQKKYYKKNKEIIIVRNSKYRNSHPEVAMVSSAKKSAASKRLPFNIDTEYLREILPEDNKCPVLSFPFKKGIKTWHDSSPSLDRIIPKLGYIKGNVQIISWFANRIKSDATPEQLMTIATYYKKITEEKNAA